MTIWFLIVAGQKRFFLSVSSQVKAVLVKLNCQHLPKIRPYFESITCIVVKVNFVIKLCMHMHAYKITPGMDLSNLQLTT